MSSNQGRRHPGSQKLEVPSAEGTPGHVQDTRNCSGEPECKQYKLAGKTWRGATARRAN